MFPIHPIFDIFQSGLSDGLTLPSLQPLRSQCKVNRVGEKCVHSQGSPQCRGEEQVKLAEVLNI